MMVRENSSRSRPTMSKETHVILTARNEAERIEATLGALAGAFPDALMWVADDGSTDDTVLIARRAGATVVCGEHAIGKGGAATRAARCVLEHVTVQRARDGGEPAVVASEADLGAPAVTSDENGGEPAVARNDGGLEDSIVILCDGDLGESALRLGPLVDAIGQERADLATAIFARRVGGGVGLAVGFAHWAIHKRCGLDLKAPLSGQRALRASVLADVLPFAHGFGMEIGMTVDAARAGRRVVEVELDLEHRATGRTPAGFAHRAAQLRDGVRAYLARR